MKSTSWRPIKSPGTIRTGIRRMAGIYRNVKLHVVDPLHISLPLYSFLQTAGPYVYANRCVADRRRES